jgi:Polyketide cyclase / dehydrase and lipid transport
MKLAAGVLAIQAYAVAVIVISPEHVGPFYAAGVLAMCAIGIALAVVWTFQRPKGGARGPVDEARTERALAVEALFFAAAISATALVFASDQPAYGLFLCAFAVVWALIWLPAPMRRITAVTSVQIRRDPASVFGFVSDERNEPKFTPQVQSVEKITDGNIGPGTQFRVRVQLANSVFEGVDEIIDYEWPHRYSERVVSGRRPNLGEMTFDATQDGGTLLSYRYESEVSYAGALVGLGLQRGQMAADLRTRRAAIWARLKQVLESPSADA